MDRSFVHGLAAAGGEQGDLGVPPLWVVQQLPESEVCNHPSERYGRLTRAGSVEA